MNHKNSKYLDRSEHKVQTMIRMLLKEHSDHGLHCLPFHLHPEDTCLIPLDTLSPMKL